MNTEVVTEFNEKNVIESVKRNKALIKRIKLNHQIGNFALLQTIITNFLNVINVYKINLTFQWEVKERILNLHDWTKEMLGVMLLNGIAGYRCNFLPFYQVRLKTHVDELDHFLIEDDVIYWISTQLNLVAETFNMPLSTLYADGHRPHVLHNITSTSEFWLFTGPLSRLYKEHQLHDTMRASTLRAVIDSAHGVHTRTTDLDKTSKTNVMQVTRVNVLEDAAIITEPIEAENEDVDHMIRIHERLQDEVDEEADGDEIDDDSELLQRPRKKPRVLPPAVTENVIYPPKIIMGANISYEQNIRGYVLELINNCTTTCIEFMRAAFTRIYNEFLRPDIFFNTYILLYINIINEIEDRMQKKPVAPSKYKKSVPYFKRQIVRWMEQNSRTNAEHVAFFQTLTPDVYDRFLNEVSVKYSDRTYVEMEQEERMAIIVAWLDHEIKFCKQQIDKHLEEIEEKKQAERKKNKEEKKKGELEEVRPIVEPITFSWTIPKIEIIPSDAKTNRAADFINQ